MFVLFWFQLTYLFDNAATVVFALFMSLWGEYTQSHLQIKGLKEYQKDS